MKIYLGVMKTGDPGTNYPASCMEDFFILRHFTEEEMQKNYLLNAMMSDATSRGAIELLYSHTDEESDETVAVFGPPISQITVNGTGAYAIPSSLKTLFELYDAPVPGLGNFNYLASGLFYSYLPDVMNKTVPAFFYFGDPDEKEIDVRRVFSLGTADMVVGIDSAGNRCYQKGEVLFNSEGASMVKLCNSEDLCDWGVTRDEQLNPGQDILIFKPLKWAFFKKDEHYYLTSPYSICINDRPEDSKDIPFFTETNPTTGDQEYYCKVKLTADGFVLNA